MEKTIYKGKEFDYFQIMEIILGEMEELDISVYAKPEYSHKEMRKIRLNLTKLFDMFNNINYKEDRLGSYATELIESYVIKTKMSNKQIILKIEAINDICIEYGIKYQEYLGYFTFNGEDSKYSDTIRQEIINGLEKKVDITIFAKPYFNASQMNQIKQGLKKGIDVSVYAKPEYSAGQMKEIKNSLLK